MDKNPIRVYEHDRFVVKDLNKLRLLHQFNDKSGNKYYTNLTNGVKFNQFVGVIQVGRITIEILPKADRNRSDDDIVKDKWHSVLLEMLRICKKIKINSVSEANLKRQSDSLLDLYFDRYLSELEYLLNKGLIKKYRYKNANTTALKGQLLWSGHIQKNLIHKERFYTKHQTYDAEHLLHQILLKALLILDNLVYKVDLKQRLNVIKMTFPEIKEISIKAEHFNHIKLNRKRNDYEDALKMAKMIILNYSPDIKGGNENMIAILFDMNKLWEEFVFKILKRHDQADYEVNSQQIKKFWEDKTIRPDIVLTKFVNKEIVDTVVIDTKWKVIDDGKPSDNDIKQMFVYNKYWNARSLLLYPNVDNMPHKWGKYKNDDEIIGICKLGFVSVLNENKLNKDIADEVFRLIRE